MPVLDTNPKKAAAVAVIATLVGVGGIVMNPTRPARPTRDPALTLTIDDTPPKDGRFCYYFEYQLSAHTNRPVADPPVFNVQGFPASVKVSPDGLVSGCFPETVENHCGDPFTFSVSSGKIQLAAK